jgi:hypothetical protein
MGKENGRDSVGMFAYSVFQFVGFELVSSTARYHIHIALSYKLQKDYKFANWVL